MLLTDLDGIKFELEHIMITHLRTCKRIGGNCTEVRTRMNDYLLVKETPAEIMKMISKERSISNDFQR